MKKTALASVLIAQTFMATNLWAQEEEQMTQSSAIAALAKITVNVGGIANGNPIPKRFAYCIPDGKGRSADGKNISPAISWSGAPSETKSYALIVVDGDVPTSFNFANKPNQIIPFDYSRRNFYHWVLVNIPPNIKGLFEGKGSRRITPGGKPTGKTEYGENGQNDYGYGGYDGPCPPWNDERMHHYHFMVYALDVAHIGLPSPITGKQVETAINPHIIGKGEVVGTYSTNPRARAK